MNTLMGPALIPGSCICRARPPRRAALREPFRLTCDLIFSIRIYSPHPETATIAASPFRQGFEMPNNGTAAQVAAEKKLYRIGEGSRLADLKPVVLRYWE